MNEDDSGRGRGRDLDRVMNGKNSGEEKAAGKGHELMNATNS